MSGGWYVGIQGGVPFGLSTFSSFGSDKTHFGWSGGIYAGHRFSRLISADVFGVIGKISMSAQDCCVASAYWLGSDGLRYYAPVAGMQGWYYSDLKSSVAMQRVGVRLNVNLLGLFSATRSSRWSLNLSPAVSAIASKATVKTLADGSDVKKDGNQWHIGLGGDLSLGYSISKHIVAALFSGLTWLPGEKYDGVPRHVFKNNYIWESGVKVAFSFGGKKAVAPVEVAVEPQPVVEPTPEPVSEPEPAPVVEPKREEPAPAPTPAPVAKPEIRFPAVYFPFNSTSVAASQLDSVAQIARVLKDNPGVKVCITGYTDKFGASRVNKRVSVRRAAAVRRALIKKGIAPGRITVRGGGEDRFAPTYRKARRGVTVEITREEVSK